MSEIPGLETDRLVFRGPTLADFDSSAAMWGDPEVTRFIGGKPFTREESWSRLCRNIGHWVLMGYGYWVVRDRAGNFVGEVGFASWKREIAPAIEWPEAGWVLSRAAHGKGYATEAVRAFIAWGERRFGNTTSACIIDPGNTASVRVAEKCGYVRQPDGVFRGSPTMMFLRA
jgi:RimJ/RimL family protein N-acetyltransferase